MQQHSSKYFTCRPPSPLTLGMGPIGQNLTFSDHGHVDIKLNGIIKCSSIVANILPADPYTPPPHHPPDPVKIQIFSEDGLVQISSVLEHGHVALQIKWYHYMYEGHPINRGNFLIKSLYHINITHMTIRWHNLLRMQQHIQKFDGM